MWDFTSPDSNKTTSVVVPQDGIISVTKPDSVTVFPYVNDEVSAVHHVHVKAGDSVYFKLKNSEPTPVEVTFDYEGTSVTRAVPGRIANPKVAKSMENNGTDSAETKDDIMTPAETINLFANPNQGAGMGGALGGGLGAGLVGGLLGNALFRPGLGYGYGADGVGATANVHSAINDATVLQALGDIKASIPFNEGQVQLALAGAKAGIVSEITSQTNAIVNNQNRDALATAAGFNNINMNIANTAADSLAAINTTSAITQKAITDASILAERNSWAITQAINNDGDKTRALIQSIDKTNDSRLITSQANEITELRHDRRLHEATGNITISNNNAATANAQQAQAQQQQQIQYQILAQLAALNADVQSVKQGSVVFNSGRMTDSGNQSAANTRVA